MTASSRYLAHRAAGLLASASLLMLLVACSELSESTTTQEQILPPPVVQAPIPEPPKAEEKPVEPPPPVEETRVVEAIAPPVALPEPPPPEPPVPAPSAVSAPEPVDVYFGYDKAALKEPDKAALDALTELLKTDPGKQLLVEGHCDERGTVAYNLTLGEKRAKAVKQYLESKGTPSSRIQTASYGKERPVCTEHSVACWKKNRRGHVVVQ